MPLDENEKERLELKMPEAEYIYIPAEKITEDIVKSADIIKGYLPFVQ